MAPLACMALCMHNGRNHTANTVHVGFGFPWLALVKGTQGNNAEIMDFMWDVGVCTFMVPDDR